MAIKIGSNFTFQGQQPNFERDRFATKTAMKAFPETSIDDGHLSYCAEDGNTYQFKSSNSVDAVTGKWRVFKANVDLSAYATKDSVATDLAKKVDIIGVYQGGSATNKYYSILTIDFPKTDFETIYLDGNIICRHFTSDIMIAFEGNHPTKVKAQAYNTILTTKYDNDISFYYLIDNEGKKVNIYVETATYDQFNFKIVNSNSLDYLININAIDAIPEGAVKISSVGYGIKNLFYATPTNTSGNPTFRAIDITDLPDLSSKYATKNSFAIDLAKKVDITGLENKSIKPAPFIIKIATITIPHIENITGTIDFNIQSRNSLFNVNINVSYSTNFAKLQVKAFDTLVKTEKNKLYYHVDTTNTIAKIVLYYNAAQYDVVTTKVTNLTGTLKLGYNIDNTIVDALPEGAIQVHNINRNNKNLFYSTPKDAAGDPEFRAIDVADIPDLSSKYATKEKAFTKDTASTEPGQVVAGPPTTQGNLYLRKLIADDIPDLKSKYQAITASGYQASPKILNATVRNNSNDAKSFIKASISEASSGKNSPDWYFATDGSIQDITASYYDKTYLDDKFKVISASLNDLVSKTYDDTEVRQLISNNTSAIGTKADKSELAKYQPKYEADYIATSDLSSLPIATGTIDLNGNQIDLPNIDSVDGYLTIMNGTVVFNATTTNLRVKELELSNVTISYSDDVNIVLDIQKLKCLNVVDYSGLRINFTEGSAIVQATLINSSIRAASLSVTETLNMYNSTCNINGNVKLTAYNSFVGDDGLSLANGSVWYNTQLDISPYYTSGWVDEVGKVHCAMFFDDTITGDSDYAPQTKAVYNALQLKADKTQLADLATKTDFVDLRNKVNAMPKTVFITQAAYDALTTKDANTIYYING